MKKASRQLGRKHSEPRKARYRESLRRRIAEGLVFGHPKDPRTHTEMRVCQLPTCGKEFQFEVRPKTESTRGRYCCQKHAVKHVSILRMKVPADFDLLYDLYVVKNLTTTEIAAMFDTTHCSVRHRLLDVGILARKVGISRYTICIEEGCDKPIYRILHKTNGSWYGKRCFEHHKQHRHRVSTSWTSRNRPRVNTNQQKRRAKAKAPVEHPKWIQTAIGL
jgi:hypothetical protein